MSFPTQFRARVTWYTEDDEPRRWTSPPRGSIKAAKKSAEAYMQRKGLDGLGEVRVLSGGAEVPEEADRPEESKREGKKMQTKTRAKLSRPQARTLAAAMRGAATSGHGLQHVTVHPHDGMIRKALENRGLIYQGQSGDWLLTAAGRRAATEVLNAGGQ